MAPDPSPERLSEASGRTFAPRALRWMVGVGIVSLLATLILSATTGGEGPVEDTADANAYSPSAVGHEAFAALLERLGVDVLVSRHRSAERASASRPLLVLEPLGNLDELEAVVAMVQAAHRRDVPIVVALPKWNVTERAAGRPWANRIDLVTETTAGEVLGMLDDALDSHDSLRYLDLEREVPAGTVEVLGKARELRLDLRPMQLLAPDEALVPVIGIVTAEGTYSLVGRLVGTRVHLLADPDILNTMGLGTADHALVAVALVTEVLGAEAVLIDEVSHGFEKPRSIWQELFDFPLILLTFHLAGLLGLTLWAAMIRFGKPEPRPPRIPSGKQTLIDNTATLLALGRHAGTGVRRYLDATLRQIGRAYGLPPEPPSEPGDAGALAPERSRRLEHLDALAKKKNPELDLMALTREAAALQDGAGRREERRARDLARRIYRFRMEMLDGHRSDS